MEEFIYENNVNDMRARDLRNLLIQKLGVSQALVNRIMDRNELKEMVTSIMYKKLQQKSHDDMMYKLYIGTAVVGVLTVLYMCRKYLFAIVEWFHSALSEFSYKSAHKVKLVMFNFQNSHVLAAFSLIISLIFETIVMLIQTSVLLGWIVPHGHVIRKFFIPTFSFPVSAGALLKAGTGRQPQPGKSMSPSNDAGGLGEAMSNFSLDLGPMITIAVLNFLINRLDEYAAGVVLQNVQSKDEKKAFKKFFGGGKKPRRDKSNHEQSQERDTDSMNSREGFAWQAERRENDEAEGKSDPCSSGVYAGDRRDEDYVFEDCPPEQDQDIHVHHQHQNQNQGLRHNHAPSSAAQGSSELNFGSAERPAYSTAADDGEGWLD